MVAGVALVRLLPAALGRRCSAAIVLAASIVCGYALLTKVFPGALNPDEIYARLREPFGYWNAVGLMAAMRRARRACGSAPAARATRPSTRSPTPPSACCS